MDEAAQGADQPKSDCTVAEFARAVRVHPITVYRWVDKGLVEHETTPTGRIRIPRTEIENCMTRHPVARTE